VAGFFEPQAPQARRTGVPIDRRIAMPRTLKAARLWGVVLAAALVAGAVSGLHARGAEAPPPLTRSAAI